MTRRTVYRTLTLALDFATLEQIRWLRDHGGFADEREVIEAGIQALSRDMDRLEGERRYREELARQTHYRQHDLG